MERAKGTDPSYLVWKTRALPLCYTRVVVPDSDAASGTSPYIYLDEQMKDETESQNNSRIEDRNNSALLEID